MYVQVISRTHGRHLTREQRQQLVVQLRQQGWSLRRIAGRVGVTEWAVWNDLSGVRNLTPDSSEPSTIVGADGKTYPASKPSRSEGEESGSEDGLPPSPGTCHVYNFVHLHSTCPKLGTLSGVPNGTRAFYLRGSSHLHHEVACPVSDTCHLGRMAHLRSTRRHLHRYPVTAPNRPSL